MLCILCMLSHFSHVRLFATPCTVTHQTPLSMGFSRQEYWSGLPFPPPGGLPNPDIEPASPALQVDSSPLSHKGSPRCFVWCVLSVQFSRSVVSDSLQPHESQHARPPCPSPIPGVHPNPCQSSRWCHPTISSSVIPFSSCPQSFPASGSFQMSQFFTSGGQSNFTLSCLFISIKLNNNKILHL